MTERVVLERRARSTGTTIQLVDRGTYTDGMEDNAEDRWETICVDHGGVCSHATRKLARSFMAAPEEWCEDCMRVLPGERDRDDAVASPVPTKTYHVVCRDCGTRWTTESAEQPRRCVNEECEAGWMDLPMFADKADADRAAASYTTARTEYVVQVFNGRTWRKVRGAEGGPWRTRDRAERIATARERAERRPSSTDGLPHRVVEVQA